MPRSIGVLAADHIAVGLVEQHQVVGPVLVYPGEGDDPEALQGIPAEGIGERIREQIERVGQGQEIHVVGVGFPGITRDGIIEESPNLQQVKGLNLQAILSSASLKNGVSVPVRIFNDADVMAAGIAATQGQLDRFIRVWTLGNGIGFGRYPWVEGIWEGGHSVVTLDPKEHFCGCGGKGHLEGIMGQRAMRLRFWDMEPEEVFEKCQKQEMPVAAAL